MVSIAAGVVTVGQAQTTLISTGAVWRFHGSGSGLQADWNQPGFNDTSWPLGGAPFGYGESDDQTPLWYGQGAPPVTSYLRHSFAISNPRDFFNLTMRIIADDGAVVYLNGQEVFRGNLPAGAITPLTQALIPISGPDESVFSQAVPSIYRLVAGVNTLAVELHQNTNGPVDARFELELIGNLPLTPPTVAITSPTDGSVLALGEARIQTAVADLDGYVYLVWFYTNGVLAGSSPASPFDFPLRVTQPGRFTLQARAADNTGRSSLSAPVHVQFGNVVGDRIVRGPYLQSGSSTSVVVRWRTDWFAGSAVSYGTNSSLPHLVQDEASVIDHEIQITGLLPDTKYFYSVGTPSGALAVGVDYHFVTSPINARPTRIWVIGDSGTANDNAAAVRDAYGDANDRHTDLWLMLGDNAYEEGTDDQYQAAVFDMYPEMLRQTVLWPTIGNHDTASFSISGGGPYFDIFTLPRKGEAGGLPSGTERYYSFDHGNVHFICMDSASSLRKPGSPMLDWLENDLAATEKDWLIAFWHHPPYSFGTHNSDYEIELIEMRRHVLPVLESYGVDLVLSGHSHNYERSFLLNGFYGYSSNLVSAMIVNADSGEPETDGAYQKPAGGIGAHRGTVYAVCGCSGEGGDFTFRKHPAMYVNHSGLGSMVLDIDGLRLDAKFLRPDGKIDDGFAIVKGRPTGAAGPPLRITRAGPQVEIWWPTSLTPFLLESSETLDADARWQPVPEIPTVRGRQHRVTLESATENRIFRLRAEP